MAHSDSYRDLAAWQKAMDLAVQVSLLAEGARAGGAASLAAQAGAAAVRVPVRIAQAHRRPETGDGREFLIQAESALLETETLLLIAVRMRSVTDAQAAPLLALVREIHSLLFHAPARAQTPSASAREAAAPAVPANGLSASPSAKPATGARNGPPQSGQKGPAPQERRASGTDRLVLDGSNFLGRTPGYMLGSEESRDRLLLRLQEYAKAHPAHRVTIFFDGQRVARRTVGGVEEHVTGGQRPADDVIVDFLHALPPEDRPRSTVVTDDRELAARARGEGTRVESIAWLAGKLERKEPPEDGRKESGVSRGQVGEWEEYFSRPPQRPGR